MEIQGVGRLKLRCKSNAAYLEMTDDGVLVEGQYAGALGNLIVGSIYDGCLEGDYWRVWDNLGKDYLYPLRMFEPVADQNP